MHFTSTAARDNACTSRLSAGEQRVLEDGNSNEDRAAQFRQLHQLLLPHAIDCLSFSVIASISCIEPKPLIAQTRRLFCRQASTADCF
jgi:hypothetical protein